MCSILFLIIMKDEGPKGFRLVKTNSALDFLKNNTLEGIIFDECKIQGMVFYLLHRVLRGKHTERQRQRQNGSHWNTL